MYKKNLTFSFMMASSSSSSSSPLLLSHHLSSPLLKIHPYTRSRRRRNSSSSNPNSRKSKTQEITNISNDAETRRNLHHHHRGCNGFVTTAQIEAMAIRRGVSLKLDRFGPFFNINALDSQTKEVLGTARGFVRIWIDGRILHLDSIRVKRSSSLKEEEEEKVRRPLFGLGLLIGAAAVCYGFAQKCTKAELLAINDADDIHSKLVRYYTRMGFRSVYHVTGESLQDFPHMLIWGGVGTRMDANIRELLLRWSPTFQKP